MKSLAVKYRPKTFADLLIISGLSHGTDVWNGNAQDLINDGVCSFQEVIGCRDDIMTGLSLNYGVDASKAFLMMERVRKGKRLTSEDEDLLYDEDIDVVCPNCQAIILSSDDEDDCGCDCHCHHDKE